MNGRPCQRRLMTFPLQQGTWPQDSRRSYWAKTTRRDPPTLHHFRAPLDGPAIFLAPWPLVRLLRFLGSGPPVIHALERKLLFRDSFCRPFRKDWLLPPWPTGGPSLWCTDGLNCVDDFAAGLLRTLECLVKPLCRACWSLMVKIFSSKLLRLRADQTVSMERICPSSSDMLIQQLQLPQSHVPADQLKVGRHCRCWSYGLLQGLMHNPDLFLHNLVSAWPLPGCTSRLTPPTNQWWIHRWPPPSYKLLSLKQVLGWYRALRYLGLTTCLLYVGPLFGNLV